MKTIPIAKPGAGPAPTPDVNVQAQKAARERAITKLSTPQGQSAPIPVNANSIAPEDMSAIVSQTNTSVEQEVEAADTAPEVPPEAPKAPEAAPEPSQMAILARKERALRAKAQQLEQANKVKEAAWQQEKAQLESKLAEYETGYLPKSYIKQNPLDALAQSESSYEELTQQAMNQVPTDPRVLAQIQRQEDTIKRLEAKLSLQEKSVQDQQSQAYKAAVKQIENDVRGLVKADPSFEMIKLTGSQKDVVELIEQTFREESRVMTVEEAAQLVEDYLVDETTKLSNAEKIKKRFAPAAPPVKKVEAEESKETQTPKPQQTQQMKTLTNTTSSSRKLTARERAMLAFKGELGSKS